MENIEEKAHVWEQKDSGLQRFVYDFGCLCEECFIIKVAYTEMMFFFV